jgi:threonine synthase
MQLYSTKNKSLKVDLQQAVFQGLPEDNGLFMPVDIPRLPPAFFEKLPGMSLPEIGFEICQALIGDYIPSADLRAIVEKAIDFPAPVVQLDAQKYVLELWHGPSLAFKDFGARFMAQLMSYFNRGESQDLVILVATSGDTGGAVASGFYQTPGIRVVILYPSGKVSLLQEKQLTTLGYNVTALEVDGSFDDCQALVKQAFLDADLRHKIRLSSANSINISRLIPQAFYYFEAYRQLMVQSAECDPVVFCVPSGNFGNLTAGILAQRMGLPVHHFIAATNVNDVVPAYLHTGQYQPRPSRPTLSNAMDVGNPSNFVRMVDLHGSLEGDANLNQSTWESMREQVSGYAFDDEKTAAAVREIYQHYHYVMDPHGAVGYLALKDYQEKHPNTRGVILETAHPAKFLDDVEHILGREIVVPERLAELADRPKEAVSMTTHYEDFRSWLEQYAG